MLVLCVVEALVNDPIVVGAAEFFIGTALIVALLVRQAVVIMENGRLTRSLAASNQQLQYQLLHDDLTGLPNRPLMLDRLRVALARMERSRSLAAVMFVDLDLFKQANDTYGHEAGDEVLIAVGRRLLTSLRAGRHRGPIRRRRVRRAVRGRAERGRGQPPGRSRDRGRDPPVRSGCPGVTRPRPRWWCRPASGWC